MKEKKAVESKDPPLTPRNKILLIASQLFYREGFHSVGIDRIVAESGVAKMTLYKHFPSKEELIVAYLNSSHEFFLRWLENTVASKEGPKDKLLAVFKGIELLASSPQCLGCTFQSGAAEFPDPKHPIHQVSNSHKLSVIKLFTTWTQEAQLARPEILAQQLLLLMDGAWVAIRMFGVHSSARHVLGAAEVLINGHPPQRDDSPMGEELKTSFAVNQTAP